MIKNVHLETQIVMLEMFNKDVEQWAHSPKVGRGRCFILEGGMKKSRCRLWLQTYSTNKLFLRGVRVFKEAMNQR